MASPRRRAGGKDRSSKTQRGAKSRQQPVTVSLERNRFGLNRLAL
jgi:hypothetical protein